MFILISTVLSKTRSTLRLQRHIQFKIRDENSNLKKGEMNYASGIATKAAWGFMGMCPSIFTNGALYCILDAIKDISHNFLGHQNVYIVMGKYKV